MKFDHLQMIYKFFQTEARSSMAKHVNNNPLSSEMSQFFWLRVLRVISVKGYNPTSVKYLNIDNL